MAWNDRSVIDRKLPAVGEDALVPPEVAVIRECANELQPLFLEPFCFLSASPPRPSRSQPPPVSSPEPASPPFCFHDQKKEITIRVMYWWDPFVRFLNISNRFSVYFSIGNRQIFG